MKNRYINISLCKFKYTVKEHKFNRLKNARIKNKKMQKIKQKVLITL